MNNKEDFIMKTSGIVHVVCMCSPQFLIRGSFSYTWKNSTEIPEASAKLNHRTE
jgi:hypothetical protein